MAAFRAGFGRAGPPGLRGCEDGKPCATSSVSPTSEQAMVVAVGSRMSLLQAKRRLTQPSRENTDAFLQSSYFRVTCSREGEGRHAHAKMRELTICRSVLGIRILVNWQGRSSKGSLKAR